MSPTPVKRKTRVKGAARPCKRCEKCRSGARGDARLVTFGARVRYTDVERRSADLARQASRSTVALLTIASALDRHIGDAIRRRERRVMGHAFRSVGTSAVDAQWHRMWLSRAGRLSRFSGEDSPLVGDAFQRSRPAVGELDAGTGDEVLNGRGDEYLPRPRERADTRADVHRDTREVIAS
jgi:hypothetical protein